jgi:integrase
VARPRNREADPVRIIRGGRAIIYYESGWVDGGRRPEVSCDPDDAEALAATIRAELYAKRRTETGDDGAVGPSPTATIEDSYEAWIAELERKGTPAGTLNKYRGNCRKWMALIGGNLCSEASEALWRHVLDAVVDARLEENTIKGVETTMRAWRKWARESGWIPRRCLSDSGQLATIKQDAQRRVRQRKADEEARRLAPSETPRQMSDPPDDDHEDDGDDDRAIRTSDVPRPSHVDALAAAIFRRETEPPPGSRANRGGAPRLIPEDGWRTGESVRTQAATGVRGMELLALHSSAISREGRIRIVRQLDRYQPWLPGQAPPLVAPKGGKKRTTQCWSWYLPELLRLCEYADEHHGGWLFAPTRNQRNWARGWADAVNRGIELLNTEATEADALEEHGWSWKPHYLRHHYASWSLAPPEVGGYGWPLATVSSFLGHIDISVTSKTYVHRVDGDDRYALASSTNPPGTSA